VMTCRLRRGKHKPHRNSPQRIGSHWLLIPGRWAVGLIYSRYPLRAAPTTTAGVTIEANGRVR
jgi:hypothetical protein